MKCHLRFVVAALAMLVFAADGAQASTATVSVGIETGPTSVDSVVSVRPGDRLELYMVGNDFPTLTDAGTFKVTWDEDVLSFVPESPPFLNPEYIDPPWDFNFTNRDNAASGSLDFVTVGTTSGFAGSQFGIARLKFDVVGSVGDKTDVSITDEDFGGWAAAGVAIGDVSYLDAMVTVVPIPAPAWLLGSALLAVGGIARRRHTG